jgi:hypothetical protein
MSSSPLPPHPHALELRHRAQVLRRLGRQLGGSPATTLALRAGPEVWAGPAAQQCLDEFRRIARDLSAAAAAAYTAARRLEAQADQYDTSRRAAMLSPSD